MRLLLNTRCIGVEDLFTRSIRLSDHLFAAMPVVGLTPFSFDLFAFDFDDFDSRRDILIELVDQEVDDFFDLLD